MTDYNKISKKENFEPQELLEQIEEIIPSDPEPVVNEGMVNCEQLYVRSAPSVDAEPLGTIKQGARVMIYELESTDEFYSVCTETGLEGFCMKKFITVL